jgi:Family of unknown function (DUF6416)
VCVGCVMSAGFDHPAGVVPGAGPAGAVAGGPADVGRPGPAELQEWSAGDAARAAVVYRQLPRWSRRLFDLLSSAPGRRFPLFETQTRVFSGDDAPFGMDDVCGWAEVLCAASGRPLPVRQESLASGETGFWMDEPAALLFQGVTAHSGSL